MSSFKGTLGEALINTTLPKEYRVGKGSNARDLKDALTSYAKDNPTQFSRDVPKIKKLGDEFATFEGITVGLDDIEPEYSRRDPILRKAKSRLRSARTASDITSILLDAQSGMKDISLKQKTKYCTNGFLHSRAMRSLRK